MNPQNKSKQEDLISNNNSRFTRQKCKNRLIKIDQKISFVTPKVNLIKVASTKHTLTKQQINLINSKTQRKRNYQKQQQQQAHSTYNKQMTIHQSDIHTNYLQKPSSQQKFQRKQSKRIKNLFSPKKSQHFSQSYNSQQIQNDKQQLLLLQIKLLKRQNTFLKKKLRDLHKQIYGVYIDQQLQRGSSPSRLQNVQKKKKKGFNKVNLQSLHISVNLFFEQIKNLLNSMTQLFKIQLSQEQINQFEQEHSNNQINKQITQQICPIKKHQILKKHYLKRKLQKISLEQQSKKYQSLLDIFSQYYKYKQLSEKKVVETIDDMIGYTNDLNKWLLEKASEKKIKAYSSKSTKQVAQISKCKKINETNNILDLPPNSINYVTKNRGLRLSSNKLLIANHKSP